MRISHSRLSSELFFRIYGEEAPTPDTRRRTGKRGQMWSGWPHLISDLLRSDVEWFSLSPEVRCGVVLHSTSSRELTFENFWIGGSDARDETLHWYRFSKVGIIVILHSELNGKLSFENFWRGSSHARNVTLHWYRFSNV